MIDCGNTIVVKDYLKDLGVEDLGCGSKAARIFMYTMRRFHLDTIESDYWRTTEVITGSGQQDFTLDYPVYKFIGLFGKESCCNSCSLTLDRCTCSSCTYCESDLNLCSERLKQVITRRSEEEDTTYAEGEYSVCGDEVHINVPECLSDGYFVYVRGPEEITDISQSIVLPTELLVALEYLIIHDYSVRERDFETANFFSPLYQQVLTKLKNKDDSVPFAVGMSVKMP